MFESELLRANSFAELQNSLVALDLSVPERSRGRQTHHVERYCIVHLLSSLGTDQLTYPLVVLHRDRPDFVLSMPNRNIGIEHTEAVPENVAHSEVLREQRYGHKSYFTPIAVPGEPRKTRAELLLEIEKDEPGDGWVGDSPQRHWAEAMFHCVKQKIAKCRAAGFERQPINWLLVYNNWSLPSVNISRAADYLMRKLTEVDAFDCFDSVFVLSDSKLCEFIRSGVAIHQRNLAL